MGMANALIRKLRGPGEGETRDDGLSDEGRAFAVIPERLGRFEIQGELGAGAMGVVYAARDPMLRRDVAIKVLARRRSSDDALARARREAQAMAQISHPNVVAVYAIGDHEGSLYIAMERIYGQTLAQWQGAERSVEEILQAYRQAGRGLAALHAAGLIHRDFKPANAMIADDGRVRVLDLGLVRELHHPSSSVEDSGRASGPRLGSGSTTVSNAVLGTPAYMSPEQFLGGEVGPAADQFSFCVALFEALHGARPFKAKSMAQLIEAMAQQRVEPPPPGSEVPRRVHRALLRGLSNDPRRRFRSMEALLDALDGGSSRRLWVGGVALVGLVGAVSPMGMAERERSCDLQQRLERIWTPSRRGAIDEDLVERTRIYAEELSAAVAAACEAPPEERGCHRQLVERFDGVLDLLVDRPEGLDAKEVVGSLPEISSCDGAPTLQGDPVENAALSRRMQRVDALALGGLLDDALKEGDEVVAQAQRLGVPRLSQRAFNERAKVHARRRELEPAIDDFTASYELAVVLGDAEQVARQALSLVWVTRESGDLDAAEHWLRVAATADEASGGSDAYMHARLQQRRGEVQLARGDMAAAQASLSSAARGWKDLDDPREEATVLTQLVWADTELGDMDAALEHAKRGIAVLRDAFGDDEPQLGTLYLNLGNAHQRRGEFEAALDAFSEAVDRRTKVYGADHPRTAFTLYSKGTAMLDLKQFAEARPVFEQVLQHAPPGHPVRDACELSLSRIASEQGDHADALARANRALVGFEEKLGADHPSSAEARANLARIELAAGDAEAGLEDIRAAIDGIEAAFGPSHDFLGNFLAIEARAHIALGHPEQAKPLFERAIRIRSAAEGESSQAVADLREELSALDGT